MVQIEQFDYSKISSGFKNKPFTVTNAWIEYLKSKGYELLFFVDNINQPRIICWARIKKIKFIGEVLSVGGPIYKKDTTYKQLHKFMNDLKSLPYKGVYVNPNTEYDATFEIAARKAMFKRPIGQSSTNLTILVNPDELIANRNWKRNLDKANCENYKFEIKKELDINDCKIIASLHKENAIMKNLSDVIKAEQIQKIANFDNIFSFFLYKNNIPIAARIISIEEQVSFDVFACNSLESRKNGANQFLMQKIFDYLKDHNIDSFDFSRIPIGKKGADGVYQFKNSTGGKIIQYNGEWVYFQRKFLKHFNYLYKTIILKEDFY